MSSKSKESLGAPISSFEELTSYFESEDKTPAPTQDSDVEFLTRSQLSQQLFARAQESLLIGKTSADLIEIVEETFSTLDAVIANPKNAQIRSKQYGKYSSLWVAMGDKPFIINSITECIRERGYTLHALLHPIVIHHGFRLSVSYIELPPISDDELQLLERMLQETMSCLKTVT
ncbi:MAG: hypothetical protein KDD62_06550, partial [Bdellovibrionales bacterium]|nr:hypothetical protein [Bdellovibrionales bacterium]